MSIFHEGKIEDSTSFCGKKILGSFCVLKKGWQGKRSPEWLIKVFVWLPK
ncbi:hypothetical protein B601_0916 [Chlamydia psittaci WS/RT/E30]|nr:hypothetical protein B601_0916 [Chlamydia psittaci WS/RT/E30]